MALNLTEEQREILKAAIENAEPYPDDAPEMNTLDMKDTDCDPARWAATAAKRMLALDDEEKKRKKIHDYKTGDGS